ncbi:MAG: phosphotransferase [Christensenellales bacterium]
MAEEVGLNVPELLEVKDTGEGWALVIRNIPGKTMAQLMQEQPENIDSLMEQFVDIQSDIHKYTCKQMGRLKDKLNAQISSLRDELDATTRYELHVRLENMKPHTKITHGDFNPTNVLIGDDGKVYILDWAHAAIGNASADAAMTYLLFALEDQKKADLYLQLLLQEERYRDAVFAEVAADRCCRADDQEAWRGEGVPDALDAGCEFE